MTNPYEAFVRHTLGCGCSDEVFQRINVSHLPAATAHPPLLEIDVGGRLLVRLLAWESPDPAQLAALLEAGKRDRDAQGFNRFRLAVAAEHPESLENAVATALDQAAGLDDRVHLHAVGREGVVELMSGSEGD